MMSPVPYRTIQCYYRHVTGMRNHQCRHARTYSPPPAPSSRGRIDGLRGSSTAMRLQWIISTSTGPRRRLPRGPSIVDPSAYYHDLSPDSVVAISPKNVDRLWKKQVFIGLDYGDTAKGELHVGKFPGGRAGGGGWDFLSILYWFFYWFSIDFQYF